MRWTLPGRLEALCGRQGWCESATLVLFSVGWGKPQLPLADFLESRLSFRTRGEAAERSIGTSLGAPSSLHGGLITRGSPLEAQFHMKGQVRVVEAAFPLRASWDSLAGYEPAISPSSNWACGAEGPLSQMGNGVRLSER